MKKKIVYEDHLSDHDSVIIKSCIENPPLSTERKKQVLEEHFLEEQQIREKLQNLEDLNNKLHGLNEEKFADIENLENVISEYNAKNRNLINSNQKMQNQLEDHLKMETQFRERLQELENILESQKLQKKQFKQKVI